MLYQLNNQEYSKINHLVKDIEHNHVVINAVVNGMTPGKIIVDDKNEPKSALVYQQDGFYYLISPNCDLEFLKSFHNLLFEEWKIDILELFFYPNQLFDEIKHILGNRKFISFNRHEYRLNQQRFKQVSIKKLDSSYHLVKMNKEIIEQFGISLDTWKSVDDFIKKGLGYCIINNDEVISKCLSYFQHDNQLELGVDTKEDYRKQGLASIVCSTLIKDALHCHQDVSWSCWQFNEASNMLAKKLGFELSNSKKVIIWDHSIDKQ